MSARDELRSDPPDDLPPNFDQWPYEHRIEQVTSMHTRKGLIMQLLNRSNYVPDEEIEKDTFLTKEPLAAIYLQMRGYAHDS